MVMCNDTDIIGHDERRRGLPSAPLDMEYENNRTDEHACITLNIQHNPYIFTYSHIHVFTYSTGILFIRHLEDIINVNEILLGLGVGDSGVRRGGS